MDANLTSTINVLFGESKSWKRFLGYHAAMLALMTGVIIIGNLVTLVALVRYRPLQRKHNVLIGSLAVADLLLGIVAFVNATLIRLKVLPPGWNSLTMLAAVVTTVSLAHMVFIGVNRFIAVVLPLRYSSLVTKRTIMLMVVLVWLIPVVLMIPIQIYAVGRGMLSTGILFVDWSLAINSMIWILLVCLLLAIMYCKIIMATRAQANKVRSWQQNNPVGDAVQQNTTRSCGNQKKADTSQKSTRLVLIIMTVALLLNMPYLIYAILLVNGANYDIPMLTLVAIAQQCYLANSGINIFIYALFTSNFRKAYRQMFCCTDNTNDTTNTNDTNITTGHQLR